MMFVAAFFLIKRNISSRIKPLNGLTKNQYTENRRLVFGLRHNILVSVLTIVSSADTGLK
jgi:hypothetical protein